MVGQYLMVGLVEQALHTNKSALGHDKLFLVFSALALAVSVIAISPACSQTLQRRHSDLSEA